MKKGKHSPKPVSPVKRFGALVLVLVMCCAFIPAARAEDYTEIEGGSKTIVYADSEYVVVSGDVAVKNETAVVAVLEGCVVVEGNVTASGSNYEHDIAGVVADLYGSSYVTGNVSATGNGSAGIVVTNDSMVRVDGNVTAKGSGSVGLYTEGDGWALVGGNVTGNTGIVIDLSREEISASSLSEYDPEPTEQPEEVSPIDEVEDETWGDDFIGVLGTVKGTNGAAISVVLDGGMDPEFQIWNNVPMILVYKLESSKGHDLIEVEVERATEPVMPTMEPRAVLEEPVETFSPIETPMPTQEPDLADLVAQSIGYIVKCESEGISLSGDLFQFSDSVLVALEGDQILVTPEEGSNINYVSAGEYATVEKNEDGTYTITVMRGGDLTIVAKYVVKTAPANTSKKVYAFGSYDFATGEKESVMWDELSNNGKVLELSMQKTGIQDTEEFLKEALTAEEMEVLMSFGTKPYNKVGGHIRIRVDLSKVTIANGEIKLK